MIVEGTAQGSVVAAVAGSAVVGEDVGVVGGTVAVPPDLVAVEQAATTASPAQRGPIAARNGSCLPHPGTVRSLYRVAPRYKSEMSFQVIR